VIKHIPNFQELVATPFTGGVNALCLERNLAGDFGGIATALLGASRGQRTDDREQPDDGAIMAVGEERLKRLELSTKGKEAVAVLLEDMRLLRELGRDPVLNLISGYPRDEEAAVVATDVFSWHADRILLGADASASPDLSAIASATAEALAKGDTWLCTYYGSPSEGLRNEDAIRKVDVPEIRAALLKEFGGKDDREFTEWLGENCYDLHYAPKPGAVPYSFGIGNLWRIAVDWPGSPVPPCVHRAPATVVNEPRLLLIC
jgi:hypothetical protein